MKKSQLDRAIDALQAEIDARHMAIEMLKAQRGTAQTKRKVRQRIATAAAVAES